MNRMKIFSKALLLLLVSLLTFAATSCSDDETGGWDGTYGYVQFKLSKKVSTRATRAAVKAMRKLASEHPSEKVGEEIRKLYSWNDESDKLINN